ncbi:MAG: hypothetical protein AAGF12_13305 [Myxococcota bacterium]
MQNSTVPQLSKTPSAKGWQPQASKLGRTSKHRLALIVWVAIYPTITAVNWLFGDLLAELPLPLRTLVLTAFLVPLMVYVLIPRLQDAWDALSPHW